MAAAGTALIAAVEDSVTRTIDAGVLAPIGGLRPAGEDIRGLKLWIDLRGARPKLPEPGIEPSQGGDAAEWQEYGDLVERALCERTKDLQLAIFLTEARTRSMGFAGARDGFWMIRGLIEGFADCGLFPAADKDDPEVAIGPLYWLNEKFPDVLKKVELTQSPDGPNFSLDYHIEATAPQGGMITRAEWDQAGLAGSVEAYTELRGSIEEAEAELLLLKQVVSQRYGQGLVSFSQAGETLEKCRRVVSGFVQRLSHPGAVDKTAPVAMPAESMRPGASLGSVAPGLDAWGDFERLAREGQIDQALRGMASLAAAEPNGRVRFQRKLLLADLCLQSNRKKLCTSILQELNEIIDKHKLESWETSDLVGGVWARLVRCYRDKAAGTENEEREAEFYLKLSRLDPWQALACGEPVKREKE